LMEEESNQYGNDAIETFKTCKYKQLTH
jgi:hypothetical protein